MRIGDERVHAVPGKALYWIGSDIQVAPTVATKRITTMRVAVIAVLVVTATVAVPAAQPTDSREQLLNLEKEWEDAEKNHDVTMLRRILDDRFIVTLGDKTADKEAFIKLFSAGAVDPTESATLTYEAVIIDGDTAVLVGTETAHGTREGAAYTRVYRYTTTYIRRQGRWQALAEHIVRVPQAQ